MIKALPKPDTVPEIPDFIIATLGSMVALTPISADANKACDAGVIAYEDWQIMGGSIMVERSCAADLVESLRDDGFVLADE